MNLQLKPMVKLLCPLFRHICNITNIVKSLSLKQPFLKKLVYTVDVFYSTVEFSVAIKESEVFPVLENHSRLENRKMVREKNVANEQHEDRVNIGCFPTNIVNKYLEI